MPNGARHSRDKIPDEDRLVQVSRDRTHRKTRNERGRRTTTEPLPGRGSTRPNCMVGSYVNALLFRVGIEAFVLFRDGMCALVRVGERALEAARRRDPC